MNLGNTFATFDMIKWSAIIISIIFLTGCRNIAGVRRKTVRRNGQNKVDEYTRIHTCICYVTFFLFLFLCAFGLFYDHFQT